MSDDGHERDPRRPGLQLAWGRVAGILLGLASAALAAEAGLRWSAPEAVGRAAQERTFGAGHPFNPRAGQVLLDDALGYRPVPGGERYGEHGAQHNDYGPSEVPGRERVLFLGDSVAARGTLTGAIAAAFDRTAPDEHYEWWNAGVDGYATGQEVGYYAARLGAIGADHVVLLFNYTDYEVTPLVSTDGEGRVHLLNARSSGASPWLLRWSHLYRYWIGRDLAAPGLVGADPSVVAEVEGHLARLRDLVQERGARLWVVVTTPMRTTAVWPPAVVEDHERTLAALERLGIPAFDTRGPLEATVAAGDPVGQPRDDLMHPSPELSARIAARLVAGGMLGPAE